MAILNKEHSNNKQNTGPWATDALCKISSESDEIIASYSKTNVSYKMAAILEIFRKKKFEKNICRIAYILPRNAMEAKSERSGEVHFFRKIQNGRRSDIFYGNAPEKYTDRLNPTPKVPAKFETNR